MAIQEYRNRSIKSFNGDRNRQKKSISNEKALSLKYQEDFIEKIKVQVNWFNNPEISPDFYLRLLISKRRLNP